MWFLSHTTTSLWSFPYWSFWHWFSAVMVSQLKKPHSRIVKSTPRIISRQYVTQFWKSKHLYVWENPRWTRLEIVQNTFFLNAPRERLTIEHATWCLQDGVSRWYNHRTLIIWLPCGEKDLANAYYWSSWVDKHASPTGDSLRGQLHLGCLKAIHQYSLN
jgi:hypothetical protein